MRYSLGMNTKLGPLTKKALKAGRMVVVDLRSPGRYEAMVWVPRGWDVGRGRSAEAALDALEAVLKRENP